MSKLYQVVRSTDMGMVPTHYTRAEIDAHFTQTGEGGQHLREELRGEPKLQGLYGPMWGGHSADGVPVVRYECPESYDMLSR